MSTKMFQFLYPILGCFVLLFLRYLLVRFVFTVIGLWFGLKNSKPRMAPVNLILEMEFSRSKKWNRDTILGLSKQLDMPEEKIEQWLSLKLTENNTTVLEKFCDSAWNFFYYSSETIFGFVVLWDKSWLWDMNDCWRDFSVPDEVWLYFVLCSSFAWLQLIGLIYGEKKKDFYLMVVHHVGLVLLLTFAQAYNFVRCFTVATFICDSNDVLLEVAKIAIYLGYQKISNFSFFVYTLWWLTVRLVLHPFWLTKSFVLDAPRIIPDLSTSLVYYVISTISMAFVTVNVLWTYFVVKAAVNIFTRGRAEDSR